MKGRVSPKFFRWIINFWPCFRGTGAWVTYIAPDWSEWRVRLPLSLRTRNYVGSIFGGSLYAAVDPPFMIMLMNILGPEYLVWDKAGSVRFRKPGRSTLYGTCRIEPEEVAEIRRLLQTEAKVDRTYKVVLADAEGTPHAEIEKVVQVRKR